MGGKRIDIVGNKYGRLLVTHYSYSDRYGNSYWQCLCDCGNVGVFRGSHLKNGTTRSCGCLLTDVNKNKSITKGKKYGKLTVLKEFGKNKYNRITYLCKCDCGNEIVVDSNSLCRGNTKSCGCLNLVPHNKLNIIGEKYGKLLVVKEVGRTKTGKIKYLCKCDCGNEKVVVINELRRGDTKSCGCDTYRKGASSFAWKGGVNDLNLPLYETYANKLSYAEKTRENTTKLAGYSLLEVRCAYCGKWFVPNRRDVISRIDSLEGRSSGERRLYCSDNCKKACPIFNQKKYPKGFKPATSREVQPELRQIVLERDGYRCTKCGEVDVELHCHHIMGVVQNPIESADVDNCITLCKNCHKEVHQQKGCSYYELKCKKEN